MWWVRVTIIFAVRQFSQKNAKFIAHENLVLYGSVETNRCLTTSLTNHKSHRAIYNQFACNSLHYEKVWNFTHHRVYLLTSNRIHVMVTKQVTKIIVCEVHQNVYTLVCSCSLENANE